MKKLIYLFVMALLVSGCATTATAPISIPNNSYLYYEWYGCNWYEYNNYEIEIISNPPGARIEVNNDYKGETPLRQVYNGKFKCNTEMVIKAFPIYPGQSVQAKFLSSNSPLPRTIYFDMNLVPRNTAIDVNVNQQ